MKSQIKSKQRIIDYGEVFTPQHIVNAMLDLVKQETERIDSHFLEPACGTGNFLVAILERKLMVVERHYSNNQSEYEHHAILAVSSIYGIDILKDNVEECRQRLFAVFDEAYTRLFGEKTQKQCRETVRYILKKNIVHGNTLAMETVGQNPQPIVFSEWSMVNGGLFKRKDFALHELVSYGSVKEFSLFSYVNSKELTTGFDVIISNPPYQSDDAGYGRSASPIYHHFINQAKRLNPRFIVMIIPSRWFAGGKGLDEFRKEMLNDERIRKLVDYTSSAGIFPSVNIAGGVCYFLWERDSRGPCEVTNFYNGQPVVSKRQLNEFPVFVRCSRAIPIIRKVLAKNENGGRRLSKVISPSNPFGILGHYTPKEKGIPCWFKQRIGFRFVDPKDVTDNNNLLNKWKLLIPRLPRTGDFSKPIAFYYEANTRIARPGECCTESWLVACAFDTMEEVEAFKSYLFTKIVRFLLLQAVTSQHVKRKCFYFVPDLGKYEGIYTDEMLMERWGITKEEFEFIESKIRNAGNKKHAKEERVKECIE